MQIDVPTAVSVVSGAVMRALQRQRPLELGPGAAIFVYGLGWVVARVMPGS
jgi:hypothetical protein